MFPRFFKFGVFFVLSLFLFQASIAIAPFFENAVFLQGPPSAASDCSTINACLSLLGKKMSAGLSKGIPEKEKEPINETKPQQNEPEIPLSFSEKVSNHIFSLINAKRASTGLKELVHDSRLDAASVAWSQKLAKDGQLSHSSSGSGFGFWAENIAFIGIPNLSSEEFAQQFVGGWVRSPGHYQNLTGNYSFTGVGVTCSSAECFAVQQFGA